MITQILLQILLIVFRAVLVSTETALEAVSDSRIEKLAAGGDKKALRLKKLSDKPERFRASVGAAVGLAGMAAAAFAADNFSYRLCRAAEKVGMNASYDVLRPISLVVLVLLIGFVTIVFGELIPRRVTAEAPEKAALRLSGFAVFVTVLFTPAVWLMRAFAGIFLRLMRIDPSAKEPEVTEEEILMMSDAGAEKGTIDEDENRIIKNVFAFDDLTAAQVCTHRTDVSVLWNADSTEVWEETIHRTRHSVFPVCGESVDNVIGVLDAKDYFRLDDKSRENIMANAVREPYFVHENMKADRLFEEMKQNGGDHFAVVVDEYGGMTGIITVTDLVEQLVGEFADDDDDEPQPQLEKTGEDTWLIPGSASVGEVSEELGISLPADKYETFGGYVIDEMGDIPRDGTQLSLEADGLRIEVLEIRHHRIEACRVEKIPQEASETETEE